MLREKTMKIEYDREVDAAYISFKESKGVVRSVRLSEDVAVDFGEHEEILGVEILDASEYLGFSPEHPKIEVKDFEVEAV